MKTFRVQTMTNKDYKEYACGGYNYHVEVQLVEARDEKEAETLIRKKLGNNYVINTNTIITLEEYEKREAQRMADIEARKLATEEKARRVKEAKEKKDLENAKAEGLTLEEYKEKKKREAKIRKAEKELEEALARVEEAREHLKKLKENF